MKAAGRPVSESRARPPCAAHGRRVARRGADDANLVVACVRDSHLSCRGREHTPAGRQKRARVPWSVPALGRPLLAFSGSHSPAWRCAGSAPAGTAPRARTRASTRAPATLHLEMLSLEGHETRTQEKWLGVVKSKNEVDFSAEPIG